jgi:hypothetical protein
VSVVDAVTIVAVTTLQISWPKEPLEIAEFTALTDSSNELDDTISYFTSTSPLRVAVMLVMATALLLTPTVFATVPINPALNAGVATVVILTLPRLYG